MSVDTRKAVLTEQKKILVWGQREGHWWVSYKGGGRKQETRGNQSGTGWKDLTEEPISGLIQMCIGQIMMNVNFKLYLIFIK